MRVKSFLHKLLADSIHKSRITLLDCLVSGVIASKSLKHSVLGRSLGRTLTERSGIRKVDRYLSNPFFQQDFAKVYGAIIRYVVTQQRPCIVVDWSKIPQVERYLLRASLAAKGRAITLYEEIHPKEGEGHPQVHQQFLNRLKALLPKECTPLLITDAGFKNPWFKAVLELGWDFIGRVRGKPHYRVEDDFRPCEELFQRARRTPAYLGEMTLTKKNPLQVHFYTVIQRLKGRRCYTRRGKIRQDKDSKNYSRSVREPWLLVSSLNGSRYAKKIVKCYKSRMSIEEAFRDTKSSQYGLGLQENKTLKPERLIVWLLLAALAFLLAWVVGYTAEQQDLQRQFQANSTRVQRVLSYVYLGFQVLRKGIKLSLDLAKIEFSEAELFA